MSKTLLKSATAWYQSTAQAHADRDRSTGREWVCACPACTCARRCGFVPETAVSPALVTKDLKRVTAANEALHAFDRVMKGERGDWVSGLFASVAHWCDEYGDDFDAALVRAAREYLAEPGGRQFKKVVL